MNSGLRKGQILTLAEQESRGGGGTSCNPFSRSRTIDIIYQDGCRASRESKINGSAQLQTKTLMKEYGGKTALISLPVEGALLRKPRCTNFSGGHPRLDPVQLG